MEPLWGSGKQGKHPKNRVVVFGGCHVKGRLKGVPKGRHQCFCCLYLPDDCPPDMHSTYVSTGHNYITRVPQVLVVVSIYRGSILGTYCFFRTYIYIIYIYISMMQITLNNVVLTCVHVVGIHQIHNPKPQLHMSLDFCWNVCCPCSSVLLCFVRPKHQYPKDFEPSSSVC